MGVVKSDAKEATNSIVADTFLRFKGLERAVIVIGDLDRVSPNRFAIRMHIAITRSTSCIRILVNMTKEKTGYIGKEFNLGSQNQLAD